MFKVALKSVLGNKLRLALTALAVVLGVAFVSGTFVLTDSLDNAFGDLLTNINEGVDVYVNPAAAVGEDVTQVAINEVGPTLPESLLGDIRQVDGVASAEGFVQGYGQIKDQNGDAVGGMGPPTFAMSFGEGGAVTIREGRAPQGPGEVIIDAATARSTGYAIGDTIPVVFADGVKEFQLVGIAGYGDADNLLGATIAGFDLPTAQDLLGKSGRLDSISVSAVPGVSATELASRVDAVVGGPDVNVITADQQTADQQADITSQLSFVNTGLLAFAGIALFVGAFLIVNTFSIIVAQRTREFALLRAVGASGAQVRAAVVIEAAVVGVVAGIVGFFSGIGLAVGLRAMFSAFGIDFPSGGLVLAPRTVVVSFLVAVVITVVASFAPARRAARISPVEALRDGDGYGHDHISHRRTVGGGLLTALGAVGILVGLATGVEEPAAFVGGGAAAMFIGVSLLAPLMAGPVARVVGALAARTVPGRLARNNAGRNPKRTASTASALMIGVALVTFVSIFAASATASVNDLFQRQLGADFTIQSTGMQGLPPAVGQTLRDVPEVGAMTPVRGSSVLDGVSGNEIFVAAADPAQMDGLVDIGTTDAALAALGGGDAILVNTDYAAAHDLTTGDTVDLTFRSGDEVALDVVGTYDNAELAGGKYLLSLDTLDAHVADAFDQVILADAAAGVSAPEARDAIEAALAPYPTAKVFDQADLREQSQQQVDQLLNILIGLLALALVIALIGIVNTLALSVFERTREIGLLRAVGMTRRQVRTMVRWEAVIVAVFGAVLGLAVGAFFGWAVVTALGDQGLPVLTFPAGRMVSYVVVAALAGVLAAVFPARRAARLDVLEAVTTE